MRSDVTGRLEKCATTDCRNMTTERSHWCEGCRISFRRWLSMSEAERSASYNRALWRWGRVRTFGNRRRVVQFRRKAG